MVTATVDTETADTAIVDMVTVAMVMDQDTVQVMATKEAMEMEGTDKEVTVQVQVTGLVMGTKDTASNSTAILL